MLKFYFGNKKIALSLLFIISIFSLNAQTYTFTSAGAVATFGPTQTQLNTAYSGTNLAGQVTSVNGIQEWQVPFTGLYSIQALGAAGGGATGGLGASITGEAILNGGDIIQIIVGQQGTENDNGTGGGGGSYVVFSGNPFIIAGGGGGNNGVANADCNGQDGPNGKDGMGTTFGVGGTAGNQGISTNRAQGGAGWLQDGPVLSQATTDSPAKRFLNGGDGGFHIGSPGGLGGFGGGGGSWNTGFRGSAGGGGYSGGGTGSVSANNNLHYGGGAGSFNSGTNQNNLAGIQAGDGQVIITVLSSGATNDIGATSIDAPTIFCPGPQTVLATIFNFSTNQITSATVNWSVDGIAQSSVNFTGLLDTVGGTGSTSAQINLGTFNFSTNNPYTVAVWTSNPNGVTDTVPGNDSTQNILQSSLPPPTGIAAQSILGNQATFTWTGGASNTWLWLNVPAGNPINGTGTAVITNTAVVTGIASETDYDFYVREVCSGGDTSTWAGPYSYRTPFLCPPNSVCFLTGGQEGRDGPSQAQLNAAYAGTPLAGNVVSNNGVQVWTVPSSGLYRIQAYGAQGGGTTVRPGGKGAHITGEVILTAGQTINVVVGQTGLISPSTTPAGNRGGGGGSFAWDAANPSQPIIAAGGGGGSHASTSSLGVDGSDLTSGTARADGNGTPGINGNGASTGGAGFLTDATGADNGTDALAAINGATGGDGYAVASHYGGFGGGGGGGGSPSTTFASGGGGGYSGGAGQGTPASVGGGGGGSYNSGVNQINLAGIRSGAGLVIFEILSSGATNDIGIVSIDSPTVFCPGVQNVIATINNFGANQITSATVNWTVDGVSQPVFNFTGLLDTVGGTGSSAQINLGAYNFATNNPYYIVAWTSNPNGIADTVSVNDSASTTVQSSLPPPSNLTLNGVTGTSASFTWSGGSANSWLFRVMPAGVPVSGMGTASSTMSGTQNGLNPKTSYDFYVREVCPTGDTSAWAGPLSFATPFFCPPGAFCFTHCGAAGHLGPSQSDCNSAYAGSLLAGQVVVNGGIQEWTVPSGGVYEIEVSGAQGFGPFGGRGAKMKADFVLVGGQSLKLLVGQRGAPPVGSGTNQYGGGGGSYVVDNANNPLIIAGGGGGNWANSFTTVSDAPTTTAANAGAGVGSTGGTGGTAGQGGLTNSFADGGGGLLGDGTGTANGFAFINGGNGGVAAASGGEGGFGGGGGASSFNNRRCGGGGGYSGGGGAHGGTAGFPEGGGGGSFNSGNNPVNLAGSNVDDGAIIIRALSSGVSNDVGIVGATPGNVVCSGDYDLEVTALNFGSNQVNNFNVSWSWNGAFQATIPITNPLDTFGGTGSSSTIVTLGNRNIVGSNVLRVWTSSPNGVPDNFNQNDTLEITLSPQFTTASITSVTNAEICGGGSVTLNASFTGNNLIWYDDPALTNQVNSGTSYTLNVTQTEVFYLRAENTNGCNSAVQTATAEVNFTPTVNFGATVTNCTAVFTGVVSNNVDSVRWTFGDGVGTSTAINPTYTYSNTQSFLVTLTAYDGTCSADTLKSIFVNCQVGLMDQVNSDQINIYPNPSSGMVNIEIEGDTYNRLEILDIKGNILYVEEGVFSSEKSINLGHLNSGKYILRMKNDSGIAIKNLVIDK